MYTKHQQRQHHCLWCLTPLDTYDFSFMIRHDYLCEDHQGVLITPIKSTMITNVKVHYFHEYTPQIASLLFRYKEHYDIPLAGCIFLPVIKSLKKWINHRPILIVPSSLKKTQQRGFIPLKRALSVCGLECIEALEKEGTQDQKKKSKHYRQTTQFRLNSNSDVLCKSIVLIDDVCTTGHSLLTCAKLLVSFGYHVECCVFAIHSSWINKYLV